MKKTLLFFFILIGIFFSGGKIFSQEIHCSFSSPVPLNGKTIAHCEATAKHFCIVGKKISKVVLYYRDPSGALQFTQNFDCNTSPCRFDLSSEALNRTGQWQVTGCADETCSFFAGKWSKCVNVGSVNVLSPVCGDGVVNQPEEECDDGNTVSGDGCDSNCHLEAPPPPPLPPPQPTGYSNPLIWQNVLQFLLYALRFIFNIVLGLSILMILLSGIFLASSRGDPIRQAKGKRTLLFALIGFFIAFFANGLFLLFKIIFGIRNF
jgi:cysteine-rich repeat protein